MRIAHISDLHIWALDDAHPLRLLNKRITGWLNLKLRRRDQHQAHLAQAVARAIRERDDIDHLVITGDLTNLALECEFDAVKHYIEHDLGLDAHKVSIIPGNHDAYTRGSHENHRFESYFGAHLASDLPDATGVSDPSPFPYVHLRGPVAIIGLSSAVPQPPLVAAGRLGRAQLAALHGLLAHAEVRARTPIILVHHPWHQPKSARQALMNGLEDWRELGAVLKSVGHGLLLHGHLHRRIHRSIETQRGRIEAIGSTSASLVHAHEDRMSGFNLYEIDDGGKLTAVEAFRFDTRGGRFVPTAVPQA